MSDVSPEIMNRMRAQLHRNHPSGEIVIPSQRRSTENDSTYAETKTDAEQGGLKGVLSRLAIKAAGPELSGE